MEKKQRFTRQEKMDIFVRDVINKMFEISGHDVTFDDIKDRKDDWFTQWTMTFEQGEQLKQWGITEIKKRFKFSQHLAEREMAMINLMWGLKYSDWPESFNKSNTQTT